MPHLTQTRVLPYSAKEIYDLVMDIEKYPEFLPWCKQAKITAVISDKNLHADLLINFKSFFEKYSSNVEHQKTLDGYEVSVVETKGPFKFLVNRWKIREVENKKCEVEFFIEFEFNSIFLTKMIGAIFEKAAEKMMEAFENRAKEKAK
jgi:coenzyme Q-binding protein COQ10